MARRVPTSTSRPHLSEFFDAARDTARDKIETAREKALIYGPPRLLDRTHSGLHFFQRPQATQPDERDTNAIASLLAKDFTRWRPSHTSAAERPLSLRPSVLDSQHQSEQGYSPSKIRPAALQYPTLGPRNDVPVYKPVFAQHAPPVQPKFDGLPVSSGSPFPVIPASGPSRPAKVPVSDPFALSASDQRKLQFGSCGRTLTCANSCC